MNYLAVVVAAVAVFALGALWYSPLLFAKPWVAAHGHTPEKLAAMREGAGKAYGITFVCYLVMAAAFHHLLHDHLKITGGMHEGALMGALIWLGFVATVGLTAQVFSDRKFAAYLIDAGYQLVYLVMMGAILGAWR